MRAEVEIQMMEPGKTQIVVDGHDVANCITGFTLEGRPWPDSTIVLHLLAPEVTLKGELQVMLSEEAKELLVRFGWTPPA